MAKKPNRNERQNRIVQRALGAVKSRPEDVAAILHELYECAWLDSMSFHGVKIVGPEEEIIPNDGAEKHRAKPKPGD